LPVVVAILAAQRTPSFACLMGSFERSPNTGIIAL
jgi:hypothetical protein